MVKSKKRENMKKLIVIIFLTTQVFSTQQINDKLIYNGRSYYIPPIKTNYNVNYHEQPTNCYRGYVATWEILNNSFYLKKVHLGNGLRRNREIEKQIGINQLATWYSGQVIIPKYKEIGCVNGRILYGNLIISIENGNVIKIVSPCLNKNNDHFSMGLYFFLKEDYAKSLACFLELTQKYPDYYKNDYTYLYIASSIKWLGNDSLSQNYLDSAKIKFPNNIVIKEMNEIMGVITSLESNKLDLSQLTKQRFELIVLFYPWVFSPTTKYADLENAMNGSLFTKEPCNNSYKIEFKRKEYAELFQKVKKEWNSKERIRIAPGN